ncbi:M67 family metallopeptidase [Paenibacillus sp. SYP-B3998]|uniref:M67 family metallopeptidase n=1 Tax=Paenibacillus sp. SYP-B3998 TaxID=2678564 RepID=A0A6G4A313_9BACL|nr:M67 family metallopeptidase [Paenibacillus sp. SYP-B3998]NEW08720.1 M67 family metallopeptidase [Paenibacillus sp. SYP-B3998]
MIQIQDELHKKLIDYCISTLPYEACGFITGTVISQTIEAISMIPSKNHASNPRHHFEMSPHDIIPVLVNPKTKVIGIFHSHPTAPPAPSEADIATLWHTFPTYWIVSLQNPFKPELQIYQIKKAPQTSIHKLSFVIGQ